MFLAVAVHERNGVHGLFAFGLELFDDDEVAVGTFYHERGRGFAVEAGGFAEDVGDAEDAGFQDDAGFAKEFVFWFREALKSDDLAKELGGGVCFGLKEGHGFIEFAAEGGFGVVLRGGFEVEDWGAVGLVGADVGEVIEEPSRAGLGKGLINCEFVEGEVFESGLVIDRPGVHSFGELHDGIAKIFVAGKDGGFDGGGAAIFGEEGRVEVEDAFWLEKRKKIGLNHDAERGEDAESVGIFALQTGGFGEIFAGASVENDVGFWLAIFVWAGEDSFREVGEEAIAKENDFRTRGVGPRCFSVSFGVSHRGRGPCWRRFRYHNQRQGRGHLCR